MENVALVSFSIFVGGMLFVVILSKTDWEKEGLKRSHATLLYYIGGMIALISAVVSLTAMVSVLFSFFFPEI
jgi:hypothetical protein